MKRTNDLLVGTVVLLVILTLTGATFWAKQTDIGDRRSKVVARFRDVGNARVGNAVVIRGVRAGTIEAIELSRGGWVHVRMNLARSMPLPGSPVVLLNESSLFGEWQATITPRSALPHDEYVFYVVGAGYMGDDVARKLVNEQEAIRQLARTRPVVVDIPGSIKAARFRRAFPSIARFIDDTYMPATSIGGYRVLVAAHEGPRE